MMMLINFTMNALFDLVMAPFRLESPWPGLIAASLLTAFVLVGLFRLTSSQTGILRARNRFLARTLELLLFQHDMRVSLTACGRILAANVVYLGYFLGPMLYGLLPLVLIFIQMDAWFAKRPLHVNEPTVLTAKFRSELPESVQLFLPEAIRQDSAPVRSPKTKEIAWRLVPTTSGNHTIEVNTHSLDRSDHRKSLTVGGNLARVSPARTSPGWTNQLFAPSEKPLDTLSSLERIEIAYPRRELTIGLTQVDWILTAVILMMIFSLVLGALFGVRIA